MLLTEIPYMTLSTVTKVGDPWISNIFFAYDKKFNFFWYSKNDTLHSQNIRSNSKVAINIVDSRTADVNALYITAEAHEVTDVKELLRILPIFIRRLLKHQLISMDGAKVLANKFKDFISDTNFRMYIAQPKDIYEYKALDAYNEKCVDGHIQIPIKEIQAIL